MGNNSLNELRDFIEDEDIKFIRLAFFDVFGNQKNVAIMPQSINKLADEGISIDASSIPGYDNKVKSDIFLKPDLSTVSIVPWRPVNGRVARVFCNLVYPDGTLYENDTRAMLKQTVADAEEKGIHINLGAEVEFYLFKQDEKGNPTKEPMDNASYMDIDPIDKGENIRRDIVFTLIEMGITPERSHHEQGPGQNEVDFKYSEPLISADNTSTLTWAIRNIANANGMYADFTPKPLGDKPGNGMHINVSIRTDDGDDTEMLRYFLAGILKHIREITLFLNPTRESYLRFGQLEAPKYISWGRENRSQLVRIPASANGIKRIEVRSPDPTANPYLAYTMLIRAGLDGIENKMELQEPLDVNLNTASEEIKSKLRTLPENIKEAYECAIKSELVNKYVPKSILNAYGAVAERE